MNPEPMHAFIDAFVIGEGEEVIHDIIDVIMSLRGGRSSQRNNLPADQDIAPGYHPRDDILMELAKIQGVYVPRFYEANYLEDGTVSHIEPLVPDVPKVITTIIVYLT